MRREFVGWVAAWLLLSVTVVGVLVIVQAMIRLHEERERVSECVASIPYYLDGLEIAYQEQECK